MGAAGLYPFLDFNRFGIGVRLSDSAHFLGYDMVPSRKYDAGYRIVCVDPLWDAPLSRVGGALITWR